MPPIREGTVAVLKNARKRVAVYGGQNSKAKPPLSKSVIVGALKDSLQLELIPEKTQGKVFSDSDHAIYQEYGTKLQKGTPFFTPAIKDEAPIITKNIKSYIKEQLVLKSKQ